MLQGAGILTDIAEAGSIAFAVPAEILWWPFGILLALFALVSLVLVYHWAHYGYKATKTGFMGALYFAGGIILFAMMFFGISSYLLSL